MEKEGTYTNMKKKLIIMATILLILVIGFQIWKIYKKIELPFIGRWYIVNFDNTDIVLEKTEKEMLLHTIYPNKEQEERDEIEIIKLAYYEPFPHEGECYVFYKTTRYSKAIYAHECMGTGVCEEFQAIKKIVDKYYRWWKNNEKYIDIKEIEKSNQYYIYYATN